MHSKSMSQSAEFVHRSPSRPLPKAVEHEGEGLENPATTRHAAVAIAGPASCGLHTAPRVQTPESGPASASNTHAGLSGSQPKPKTAVLQRGLPLVASAGDGTTVVFEPASKEPLSGMTVTLSGPASRLTAAPTVSELWVELGAVRPTLQPATVNALAVNARRPGSWRNTLAPRTLWSATR